LKKKIPFKDSDKQYDLVEIEKETDKEIQAGSKVKYLAETTWAYKKGKIYVVCGYDREFDASEREYLRSRSRDELGVRVQESGFADITADEAMDISAIKDSFFSVKKLINKSDIFIGVYLCAHGGAGI
jgi:hypothetical protein